MDDLKNMFGKLTKNITKTSSGMLKSVKLSMSLAGEEDKLKSIYSEIGKKVHEIYAYGGTLGAFFDEKYAEILQCEKQIKELKELIEASKGTMLCPNCSKSISDSAVFCPKCGYKMVGADKIVVETPVKPVEEEIPAAPLTPEPRTEPVSKVCSACGHVNSDEDKFCLACGRNL
ncbi:MAG: zinc ribbon domain-containing protein [Clostridiales bacterium]|nr:zinc ribbon domain-containing protein [Clostridiales bacterium]